MYDSIIASNRRIQHSKQMLSVCGEAVSEYICILSCFKTSLRISGNRQNCRLHLFSPVSAVPELTQIKLAYRTAPIDVHYIFKKSNETNREWPNKFFNSFRKASQCKQSAINSIASSVVKAWFTLQRLE